MNSLIRSHDYLIEVHATDAEPAGQASVQIDFSAAEECVRFESLKRQPGSCDSPVYPSGQTELVPVWSEKGEPHVEGFRIAIEDGFETSLEFPKSFFQKAAGEVASQLVVSGKLKEGATYNFEVFALTRTTPLDSVEINGNMTIKRREDKVKIPTRPIADWMSGTETYGVINKLDFPLFIPRQVLEEAIEASQDCTVEIGGILVGHLYADDADSSLLYGVVSTQLRAKHCQEEQRRLTFTPETWSHHASCMTLRKNKYEIPLGFWHLHPRSICQQCSPEAQKICKIQITFSVYDVEVMQTVFPRPYQVGLLISDSYSTGITTPLFGWRQGQIASCGYYILNH